MKVTDLNVRENSNTLRYEVCVTWEDVDRPPFTWYVETDSTARDSIWPDPNGLLLGVILPAWHAGESRVRVDGELCPVLTSNLEGALGVLRTWFPEMGAAPAIEPTQGSSTHYPIQAQAAVFLSCGIDSLATLRWNKLHIPPDHPAAIAGALYIEFAQHPDPDGSGISNEQRLRRSLVPQIAADAGIHAIPVRTNLWHLDGDGWFYDFKWHGAFLAAVAQLFSRGYSSAYIGGSAYPPGWLGPWGSHPMLDPYYSSAHLRIQHHGLDMSRIGKTRLVADWPAGLRHIMVCQGKPSPTANCGTCEKCLHTMTSLVALGRMKEASSFPVDDVTPGLLSTVMAYDMLTWDGMVSDYEALVPLLQARGRNDLAAVINMFRGHWERKVTEIKFRQEQVAHLIPEGEHLIIASNDEAYFTATLAAERPGRYWVPPRDGPTAVRELEHLRKDGVSFLVLTGRALWWLDFYSELREHLAAEYRCLRKDAQVAVYDMRPRSLLQ